MRAGPGAQRDRTYTCGLSLPIIWYTPHRLSVSMASYASVPNRSSKTCRLRSSRATCSSCWELRWSPSSSDHSRHSPCSSMRWAMASPPAAIAASKWGGSTLEACTPARRPHPGRLGGCEPVRGHHLVDHRVATGPQRPAELAEGGLQVLHVHKDVPAPDQVRAAVGLGEPFRHSLVH